MDKINVIQSNNNYNSDAAMNRLDGGPSRPGLGE